MILDDKKVDELLYEAERVVKGSDPLDAVCRLLRDRVGHYDWVGFYLVNPERDRELILGPFAGDPTEHTVIGFGTGICGQAAEKEEPFLVQDVTREKNYLSCSPGVRSEIVLPIFRDGSLVGELDIDSRSLEPFTELDTVLLEGICNLVSPYI
ncbi:MAG: GAF domain-containing protein [Thermoplasmatota archaeon]